MSSPDADLLKVPADAGLGEIKKAYRKAALAHHPDQNSHPEAARHFRRLTEAYRALEAKARVIHPHKSRPVRWEDRVTYLLGDIHSMTRRWGNDGWDRIVDGLPSKVWLASILEVLARCWPGPFQPTVTTTPEGISQAVAAWKDRLSTDPIPQPVPKALAKGLATAVGAAERRLKTLDRSTNRPPR